MCTLYLWAASKGILRRDCIHDGKFIDLIGEVQHVGTTGGWLPSSVDFSHPTAQVTDVTAKHVTGYRYSGPRCKRKYLIPYFMTLYQLRCARIIHYDGLILMCLLSRCVAMSGTCVRH
jgi:hypothetical protein